MKRLLLALVCSALAACASNNAPDQGQTAGAGTQSGALYDAQAVPAGPVGESIKYGRELMLNTRAHLKGYITANMDCAACHIGAGTKGRGGSFVGTATAFPQWNKRAKRVIALQDRLAECFLYSMNGHPPAYNSREMVALAAYITYLSRDLKMGSKPSKDVVLASITLPHPDPKAGSVLYAQRCATCHAANGAGGPGVPPLWGATSFNDGAGMHRLRTMAGFVRYNMPQNAPGSLTDRQAFDIAAFVLTHPRPHFQKTRMVTFPAARADYF